MDLRALVVCLDQESANLLTLSLSELGIVAERVPHLPRDSDYWKATISTLWCSTIARIRVLKNFSHICGSRKEPVHSSDCDCRQRV